MNCPFCFNKLQTRAGRVFTNYICLSELCFYHDVSNYSITYWNYPTKLYLKAFRLDKYYVKIEYDGGQTTISKINTCLLFNSVIIQKEFETDFKDPAALLEKIKLYLTFS